MYLAMKRAADGSATFVLRHSYQKDGKYLTMEVMELGEDPESFIVYLDGVGFYISPEVEEALGEAGIDYEYEELEEIFWPFLDPDIKQRIDNFGGRTGRSHPRRAKEDPEAVKARQANIHDFDRRRMLFMKFLQTDLSPLMDLPVPFLDRVLQKSRDEIEHMIEYMELELKPWELRSYLYTIFGMPERFRHRLSRFIPDVQDQETMDRYFVEELCRLNSDTTFLDEGSVPNDHEGLHPYLRRYLFLYFDTAFRGPQPGRRHHQAHGTWAPKATGSDAVFLEQLGLDLEEFNSMSEKEFVSHFRRLAQKMHPDKGGDHDAFIRLQQSFKALLVKKRF